MSARERIEQVLQNAERFAPAHAVDSDPYEGFDPYGDPDAGESLPFGSEQALAEAFTVEAEGKLRWTPGMDWMVNTARIGCAINT